MMLDDFRHPAMSEVYREKDFVVRNDHSQVVEGRRKVGFMKQKDIRSIS